MHPSNFDIPSVLRIPDTLDGIIEFVRTQITDNSPSVIVLDLEQGTAVVQKDRQESPELSKDSLPFLLSNHTLEMSEGKSSIEECIGAMYNQEGLICVFLNPVHKGINALSPIFYSTIVTEFAVVGYYSDKEDNKKLKLMTIGE